MGDPIENLIMRERIEREARYVKDFEDGLHPPLKDSGERRTFETGAQRDRGTTKGRPDLRPVHALHALDVHMEKGAAKYEDRNWEKGMPLSEFYNSAMRHAEKFLAGYDDEDHLSAWLWNVACLIETKHRINAGLLPEALNDLPNTFEGREPSF